MGNRPSAKDRQKREALKDEAFIRAKNNIHHHSKVSTSLILHDNPAAIIQNIKENQLDRRGKPFTKGDLVALLMRLRGIPENSMEIYRLQTLSNDDIRSYIRLQLYSPESVEEKSPPPPYQGEQQLEHSRYVPVEEKSDMTLPPSYQPPEIEPVCKPTLVTM